MTDKILLGHGSGGRLTHDLVRNLFFKEFRNPILAKMDDKAVFDVPEQRLAYTTDSFIVTPIFFPGGDIGKLAVCGTVNDLAMCGAKPLYLSAAFILEQGLPLSDLKKITSSMRKAAKESGAIIVTGDTKVAERGAVDKIFITTTGIGIVEDGVDIFGFNARVGDSVIVSGTVGDHGIVIMSKRAGIRLKSGLRSDCAPLNDLVASMLKVNKKAIHCLRDPSRGGLATILNEISIQAKVGIEIEEKSVPVKREVRGACELLGLEPLYIANEGKLVAIVDSRYAKKILSVMQKHRYGKDARIIGRVVKSPKMVMLRTVTGGARILDMLSGEQLPRIC